MVEGRVPTGLISIPCGLYRMMKFIISIVAITLLGVSTASATSRLVFSTNGVTIPTADAFFSPKAGASDSNPCTFAQPCLTPQKALAVQAALITSNGPNYTPKILWDGGNGPFWVNTQAQQIIYTPDHTQKPLATFTGAVAGNVLTTSSTTNAGSWSLVNSHISGPGIRAGTTVVSQLSGATGGNGTYLLNQSTKTYASASMEASFYSIWDVYNGSTFTFDGGLDTAGTWSNETLSNGTGAPACISSFYHGQNFTEQNRSKIFGDLWINGRRVHWTREPRVVGATGGDWAQLTAGSNGGAAVTASVATGPTATFNSTSSVVISDTTGIGNPPGGANPWGQTISFYSAVGNINQYQTYWILSKTVNSPSSGQATITLGVKPAADRGTAVTVTASGTATVNDMVQSPNSGDRTNTNWHNEFPVNASYTPLSSKNQKYVRVEFGYRPAMAPIAHVQTSGTCPGGIAAPCADIAGRMTEAGPYYHNSEYAVWNRWEALGATDPTTSTQYTNEMYFDVATGDLHVTPLPGESCSSYNTPGTAIIPGPLETIMRLSNSTADYSGSRGQEVGHIVINHMTVQHTNSSITSGDFALGGARGGAAHNASVGSIGAGVWAIENIGAVDVNWNYLTVQHVSGQGIQYAGCGSHNDKVYRAQLLDIGVSAAEDGMVLDNSSNYYCENDSGYYGTRMFGATTPSFNEGGSASPVDMSGNHDCCNMLMASTVDETGLDFDGGNCVGSAVGQQEVQDYNQIYGCPAFGLIDEDGMLNPQYSWLAQQNATSNYPAWGREENHNDVRRAGFLTVQVHGGPNAAGSHIPGASLMKDFAVCYNNGPEQGDATGNRPAMEFAYNLCQDVSGGNMQYNISPSQEPPSGTDAIDIYLDFNNANGYNMHDNVFCNQDATHLGFPTFPAPGKAGVGARKERLGRKYPLSPKGDQ